jgi:hypothetical protein
MFARIFEVKSDTTRMKYLMYDVGYIIHRYITKCYIYLYYSLVSEYGFENL